MTATDDALREVLREKLAEALGDAMDCTRQWSAWGSRNMSEADFSLVREDDGRLEELVDAAMSALEAQSAELARLRVLAGRYEFLRRHTRGAYGIDTKQCFILPHVAPVPCTNIMKGSVGQHLDAAIDAAIASRNGGGDRG